MDAYEKRADAADARMQRVEALLTDIRLEIANLRGEVRQKPSSATI
jgi:hypothetical protein